jgi:hypothetical protein
LFIKNYSPKIFGIDGKIVPIDGIEPQSMTIRLERISDCDLQQRLRRMMTARYWMLDARCRLRLWRILFYVANFEEEQRRKQIHQEAE